MVGGERERYLLDFVYGLYDGDGDLCVADGGEAGAVGRFSVLSSQFSVVGFRVFWFGRFLFDALAELACSGQALAPLVKTRGFGMTPV